MSFVYITDYIKKPDLEKNILRGCLSERKNANVQVLLVWHECINAQYLDQFPKLKGIIRYGVGFDNIDLEEIKNRGLVFCNTPDYGIDEVSDTALTMILNILRGVTKYNHYSKKYKDSWQENTLTGLRRSSETVLGIIGAGRIGTSLMLKAKAIKINVMFIDPYKDIGYEKSLGVDRAHNLGELLEKSDVVSIHTPLTNETRNMVDAEFISSMKQGSALVNTARGEIVSNLDLLYGALKSGKISHVALDVLPDEPPLACKLINAWREQDEDISQNIIINPHTSYYSIDAYKEMRVKAALNAKRILDNMEPLNIIVNGLCYD